MLFVYFFFFNDTATTEIYTLSLHDALPIWQMSRRGDPNVSRKLGLTAATAALALTLAACGGEGAGSNNDTENADRKSTRLNSSHANISYAVFCLKKKKKNNEKDETNIRKSK